MMAADFVEHEETPGHAPTKAGVKDFFRMFVAAFPDLRFVAEDSRFGDMGWGMSIGVSSTRWR